MNASPGQAGEKRSPIWLIIVGFVGVGVLVASVLLATVIYSQVSHASPGERFWPLPGLFFVTAFAALLAGWAGTWLVMQGTRRPGSHLLWLGAGVTLGLALVSLFSVGPFLLPLGLVLAGVAVLADWGHWRRLLIHAMLLVAVGATAGFGLPMLRGLAYVGASITPVAVTTPAPGTIDVPLDTMVVVELRPGAAQTAAGTSTSSIQVSYADAGFLWLRPQPGGRGSGSMSSAGGTGRLTFTPTDGFGPCRTVRVEVQAGDHAPYTFTFRTACTK